MNPTESILNIWQLLALQLIPAPAVIFCVTLFLFPFLLLIKSALKKNLIIILSILLCISLLYFQIFTYQNLPDKDYLFDLNVLGQYLSIRYLSQYSLIFITCYVITLLFSLVLMFNKPVNYIKIFATIIAATAAISVCLSKDLLSAFFFYELTAIASLSLIFNKASIKSFKAAKRYLALHAFGSTLLLAGILGMRSLVVDLDLRPITFDISELLPIYAIDLNGTVCWLIILGLLINLAVFPLSSFAVDAYDAASDRATIPLIIFPSKTLIFILINILPGSLILLYVGIFTMFYGIIYALMENKIKRMLLYSLISQIGFILISISIDSKTTLNTAAFTVFTHTLTNLILFSIVALVSQLTNKKYFSEAPLIADKFKLLSLCLLIACLSNAALPYSSGFFIKNTVLDFIHVTYSYKIYLIVFAAITGSMLCSSVIFPYFMCFYRTKESLNSDITNLELTKTSSLNISAIRLSKLAIVFIAFILLTLGLANYFIATNKIGTSVLVNNLCNPLASNDFLSTENTDKMKNEYSTINHQVHGITMLSAEIIKSRKTVGYPFTSARVAVCEMIFLPLLNNSYTALNIIHSLQLYLFAAFAFILSLPLFKYARSINLDFDWFYRKLLVYIFTASYMIAKIPLKYLRIIFRKIYRSLISDFEYFLCQKNLSTGWTIDTSLALAALLLICYIIFVNAGYLP